MLQFSTKLILELQYYFRKMIIGSSLNQNNIPYPAQIEEYTLKENKSFIRMLFDDNYPWSTYRYLYRRVELISLPDFIRTRLAIFPHSGAAYVCDFDIIPDYDLNSNCPTNLEGSCHCNHPHNPYSGHCTAYNPELIECPFQGTCRECDSNNTGCPTFIECSTCHVCPPDNCPTYDPRYIMECADSGRCPDSIRCPNSGMICAYYLSGCINPDSCFVRDSGLVQTYDNGNCCPCDSTADFNYNFFCLKTDDFTMLNKLLQYRQDSSSTTIVDIVYSDLETCLSRLIYIYLDLKLNENYSLYDNLELISGPECCEECGCCNLCLLYPYETYVGEEIFKFISGREAIPHQ